MSGRKHYNNILEGNWIDRILSKFGSQLPQESIKNFYFCLNRNKMIYDPNFEKGQNIASDRLRARYLPIFNFTTLRPIEELNMCTDKNYY